jgi:hypothetical protein
MAGNVTIEHIGKPTSLATLGAWVKENAIAIGERELSAQVARGFDASPVVITDGVPRRDYRDVKHFGKFEFARRGNMAEVVLWALDALRKRSPIRRGAYVQSHIILINGVSVEGNIKAALEGVKDTDRVQIANTVPYARKLEGATASKKTGRGKRKPSSRQAPGGIYRVVVRELVARYGRSMFFDYKMLKLNLGVSVWGDQGGRFNSSGAKRSVKRVQRAQVYPALQFFIKPTGLSS